MKQSCVRATLMGFACAGLVGCNGTATTGDEDREYGTLSAPLSGISTEGALYRLRDATFDLTGRETLTLDSEDFLDQLEITSDLQVGGYQIELLPNWFLEREEVTGFIPVEATLETENPIAFDILGGLTTEVTFGFKASGDDVVLQSGTLSVVINIDDTPEESTAVPGPGDIVITEFMANPSAVGDEVGEWFEVLNLTGLDLDLSGCEIADLSTTEVITAAVIPPNGIAVFVRSLTEDFADFPFNFALNNGTESLSLTCGTTLIDAVSWTATGNGISTELSLNHQDALSNDDPNNWCSATTPYSLGDLGTPGILNILNVCSL